MAVFLFIAGLTGSVIAFERELDTWLNPEFLRAEDRGVRLPMSELAARSERADPRIRVTYIEVAPERGGSAELYASARTDPKTGKPFELDYDTVFMDPASGEILG